MRISDWSSDVCSSDLEFVAVNLEYFVLDPAYACRRPALHRYFVAHFGAAPPHPDCAPGLPYVLPDAGDGQALLLELDPARVQAVDYLLARSEEPTSELQSLMRISYAVFSLTNKT